MIDFAIYTAYILILICAVTAVVFGIIHLARDPKQALWSLLGVVIVSVVFGISYSISSGDFTFATMDRIDISPGGIKLVGAGLITFYLLAAITIIAAVVGEVVNFFK